MPVWTAANIIGCKLGIYAPISSDQVLPSLPCTTYYSTTGSLHIRIDKIMEPYLNPRHQSSLMGFFRREHRKPERSGDRGAIYHEHCCEDDYEFEPRLQRYSGRDMIDARQLAAVTIRSDNANNGREHCRLQRTPVDYNPQFAQRSFSKGMAKLFKQLATAERFYRDFQTSFDNDIVAIKKYATAEIRNTLWILKVGGGDRHRRRSSIDQAVDSADDSSSDRPYERFKSNKHKLLRALDICLSARPPPEARRSSKRNTSREEAAMRLYRKVQIANEQITELLDQAPRKRECCSGLVGELEMLKTLVDPENESNKISYKKGGKEDQSSGSDAGIDSDEGNRDSGY